MNKQICCCEYNAESQQICLTYLKNCGHEFEYKQSVDERNSLTVFSRPFCTKGSHSITPYVLLFFLLKHTKTKQNKKRTLNAMVLNIQERLDINAINLTVNHL